MLKVAMSAPLSVLAFEYVPTLDDEGAGVKSVRQDARTAVSTRTAPRPTAAGGGAQVRDLSFFTVWHRTCHGMASMDDARGDHRSQEGGEMVTRKTVGVVVAGLGLVLSSALVSGAVAVPRTSGPVAARPAAAPWARHLAVMDAALAAGNVTAAHAAWLEAYGAALGSRRWDGFADAGDAALRLGRASGAPEAGVPRARDLYLSALFRARDTGSLDGVLRVAAAFGSLGDRDVTAEAIRMADRLAARGATPDQRARLAAVTADRPITIPADI
jgi:hypothetical protein